nr:DUF4162 domain-containing protein [Kineococcus aurantiacus]
MHRGRVVASGEPEKLRRERGGSRYELVSDADLDWVRDVPGVRLVERRPRGVVLELLDGRPDLDQQVLAEAVRRGPVRSFAPLLPTLSELFQEVSR